jgi:hypothetical protein
MPQEPISSYHYALSVNPGAIEDMSREQLLQLALEQYTLLCLLIGILYNVKAGFGTRLVAMDLAIVAARRTIRRTMDTVFTKMPIGLEATGDRLGMHENKVGTAYKAIEESGLIVRDSRYDKDAKRRHLDISLGRSFWVEPDAIQDKKERVAGEKKPACTNCGSERLDRYSAHMCTDCGYTHLNPIEIQPYDPHSANYRLQHESLGDISEQMNDAENASTVPTVPSEVVSVDNASSLIQASEIVSECETDRPCGRCGLVWKVKGDWIIDWSGRKICSCSKLTFEDAKKRKWKQIDMFAAMPAGFGGEHV